MKLSLLAAAVVAALAVQIVEADTTDHKYKNDEHIELWVNKVGPYANPQEAYEYYKLPYCAPDTNITPKVAADPVVGMNGNLFRWENILEVMRYATRATTSSS